jgi:hypothetical protein
MYFFAINEAHNATPTNRFSPKPARAVYETLPHTAASDMCAPSIAIE